MSSKGIANNRATVENRPGARELYDLLTESRSSQAGRDISRDFLREQLDQVESLPCDLPNDASQLLPWMERNAIEVGNQYASYLATRKAGGQRQYFTTKAHALSFLQQVAPTKLVDGAWLYGTLQHWEDQRFYPLIRTYLEELGDGDPAKNHVTLYQRLLAENGCDTLPELSDEHYVQGAIQLALAYHADEFMPELIGYNLGYEQLPLHLLITAFELAELHIDPYYFTLHVTVDNASTGHARKAVQSVLGCLPTAGDPALFLRRVANGYQLNDLGVGTTDIINDFDLDNAVIQMLERKSIFGRHIHSDFCTIGGRTVNEWLAKPGQMRDFLGTLQAKGWIKRHQAPENSRFWRLIDEPKAQMAGVFSGFEKQLLHDWIAGNHAATAPHNTPPHTSQRTPRPRRTFRRYRQLSAVRKTSSEFQPPRRGGLDEEVKHLDQELRQLPDTLRMQRLISLMAPHNHATAAGLFATQQFASAVR